MTQMTNAEIRKELADQGRRLDALEKRAEEIKDAAERLVRCLYLYGGYTVDSRGPQGCIMEALEIIAPGIYDDVKQNDARTVYQKHWADR